MDAQGGQPHPVEPGDESIADDADESEANPCPCRPDRRRQLEDHQGDQHTNQRSPVAARRLNSLDITQNKTTKGPSNKNEKAKSINSELQLISKSCPYMMLKTITPAFHIFPAVSHLPMRKDINIFIEIP